MAFGKARDVRKAIPKKSTSGKIVPKKPRIAFGKAKTPAELKKLEAAAASKSTALARIQPMEIAAPQPITQEAPAGQLSRSFIKEAQRLDERIVKTIDRMGKDVISLGEAFNEVQSKGYHVALGFKRMEDYINARWMGESKTQVFQAMRIVRELTSGPNPVATGDDIRNMTKENAEGLAKLKKQGTTITPKLIQEAKTLTVRRFQEEIVLPQMPEVAQREAVRQGTHLATAPEILVRRTHTFSSTTAAMEAKCLSICRWLGDKDPDPSTFEDRAYSAIFGNFLSEHQAEYEQFLANQEAEQSANAIKNSDAMGSAEDADEEDEEDVANVTETSEDGEEETETPEARLDQAHGDEEIETRHYDLEGSEE